MTKSKRLKDEKRLKHAEKRQEEIHQAQLGRRLPKPTLLAMSVKYHIRRGHINA
jgi:hypothetical protein